MISMVFVFLSIILALWSLLLLNKRPLRVFARIIFAIGFLLITSSNLFFIIADYFSGNGIDEAVIYHLKYGLQGGGHQEYMWVIISTIIVLVCGFLFPYFLIGKKDSTKKRATFPSLLVLISIIISPGIATTVPDFLSASSADTSTFHQYYQEPKLISRPDQKKNIVYIYAESLERTYFDQKAFPGLTDQLRKLEEQGTTFTNINQVANTGWTIAGIVASHCGIPLTTASSSNSMSGMDTFLQGATCLGDLLHDEGYNLQYFGGADLEFAGKGKFLTTHKIQTHGQEELSQLIPDQKYRNAWGIYDDSLFKIILPKLKEIASQPEPFATFILTLDTHHPEGLPSASCKNLKYGDGTNSSLNAVLCSDHLISEFVNQLIDSEIADNTLIVIASDHLALNNTATTQLQKLDRRDFFIIIDPSNKQKKVIDQPGTTLDIAPTVLHALGYQSQLGLGRNLFQSPSLFSEFENFELELHGWKQQLSEFWQFPSINEDLLLNPTTQTLSIGERQFRFPLLIELDQQNNAVIKFDHGISPKRKRLTEHFKEADPDKRLVWIDHCSVIKRVDKTSSPLGKFCLTLKQANGPVLFTKGIDQNSRLRLDYLQWSLPETNNDNKFIPFRIAHAGGGYQENAYTNSLEALNFNIRNGYRYFEIDFSFTSDDRLACIHDWNEDYKRSFGLDPEEVPSFRQFLRLNRENYQFTKCYVERLKNWLLMNPSAYIITDVKENNLKALEILAKDIPNAAQRIIPQIYDPANFQKVKDLGYEQVIWTLYRYNGTNKEVLKRVKSMSGNFAITMPEFRAKSDLPAQLRALEIPTYVHTINDPKTALEYFQNQSISEIYTDYLPPLSEY